jgi:intein/homing endonuclease
MLDLNQCSGECFSCIKGYKKKYSTVAGESFEIMCDGILKKDAMEEVLEGFPDAEKQSVASILDPVVWAEENLDWYCLDPDGEVWKRKNPGEYARWVAKHPGESIYGKSRYHRPYQALMLRCSSSYKIFRIGRQAGKCLPSGTLIQMADGTQKPIEDVKDGDLVVSINDNYTSVINPAYKACNGVKDSYRITLMDGRKIEATGNHPFLSRKNIGREPTGNRRAILKDEWIETFDLSNKDYLAVPRNIEIDNQETIPVQYLTILGCMIADGNITGENCRFSNGNSLILSKFKKALEYFKCSLTQYECDKSKYDFHISGEGCGKNNTVRAWFREIGLQGLGSHQKFIPDFCMRLNNENIVELLRSMFGCEGWASVSKDERVEIGYCTTSDILASQVISLLSRFGIYASCRDKISKLNGKNFNSHQITITRKESIANFRNKIGILGKEEAVEKVYNLSQKKNSSYKTEVYEDNDITFIQIRSVEYIGKRTTWDLTVPKTHNFIANNIVTHNTESLVVSMLYHMFTKPGLAEEDGFKIVVITPYLEQVTLIFTRAVQLIKNSPTLKNSIRRSTQAPNYCLELNNESRMKGFTAGTKSGGNAGSVRGQAANMLVFDESDYLNELDIDAALSIITNFPDASIWMSSTPTGKRGKFFKTCFMKDWKEFHFPSSANPLWDKKLEVLFKQQYTEAGYKHEALAEFGEQEEGVFQVSYVEAAREKYNYSDMVYNNGWMYSIGVDWNDQKNGTCIVVVGFNPATGIFKVVEVDVISREGWTQLAACQKIAELNKLWNPMTIYIDAGHGGTQWEVLRKFSFDSTIDPTKGPTHADSRIKDILTKYDFGSKIETRDLWTKEIVQKDAKPFLVENTVRRFEAQDIKFSYFDESLQNQLMGYLIDHKTQSGKPTYKATSPTVGDHILDALMLAMMGFTMEKSPLGKPSFVSDVSFSGQFGEKTESLIHKGDTIVYPDVKYKARQEKEKRSISTDRLEGITESSFSLAGNDLPAAHTNIDNNIGLWVWEGFGHDAPRPQIKNWAEAESDAKRRLMPRTRNRPVRKNI